MNSNFQEETQVQFDPDENHPVINHLSEILNDYLRKHSRITLNGLSKRCQVSEPTIRRIAKRQIKTVPNLSTVLDLLSTITKKKEISEILKLYPGPVGDFIREALPHAVEQGSEFSSKVNKHLRDPIKYLIFKLSLNSSGVTEVKIRKLFGDLGINDLRYLIKHDLVKEKNNVFFSTIKNFTTDFSDFVDQFKASANFIKPHSYQSRMTINPLFINASESVTIEAYKDISKVQRTAFKKISEILSGEKSKGSIPIVYLCALDTLDVDSALELANKMERL